jgi:hypothetical protein
MATITSAQTGNFSDTATWVGGVVPTVGDIAVAANGHIIAIDVDVTVTQVDQAGTGKFTLGNGRTLTANVLARAGTFTSGGTVEVTATTGNTATIIGNVTGVSTTTANVAGVVVTGAGTLDLTGNISASAGSVTEANRNASVYTNVSCTINITGNIAVQGGNAKVGIFANTGGNPTITVTGNVHGSGTANFGHGIRLASASATVTVTGNVTGTVLDSGGGTFGISATGASNVITVTGNVLGGLAANTFGVSTTGASASVTVTGDVTGGTGTTAHGVSSSDASATVTVVGDVTGGVGSTAYGVNATGASATVTVVGNVTGGVGSTAHGIYAAGASSIVNVTGTLTAVSTTSCGVRSDATTGYVLFGGGNLIDSPAGATALFALRARIKTAGLSGYNLYSTTDGFITGSQVQRVSADIVTGMPAISDVRSATLYGFNNQLTGTMIVPPSSSVLTGVLVDNGTGSLTFDTKEEIADAVLHLLAGISETNSIVTIPFYSGSKDYTRTTIVDGTRTKTFTEL